MGKDKLIPAENIPEYLPVKMPTIRSWIMQKKLPVIRLGKRVFIKREVIERIQEEGLSVVSNEGWSKRYYVYITANNSLT